MDPWDHVRRAVADRRSGSIDVALRAAEGMAGLTARRERVRAARALLRAHPAMALLWRLAEATLNARDPASAAESFADRLDEDSRAAADGVRWIATRRGTVVLTHSSSASIEAALGRIRSRVSLVRCTASLPGGEGRALARRLERAGFDVEVVPDAAIATACEGATLALVGADAVTDAGVVNKVGTRLVALAAREAGIGCYAIASTLKFVPSHVLPPHDERYERTALALFDSVVTERGPLKAGAARRTAARVRISKDVQALGRGARR